MVIIHERAAQDFRGKTSREFDHLVEHALTVRNAGNIKQESHAMRRHRLHRLDRKTSLFLIEQDIKHIAIIVAADKSSFCINHHTRRLGQRAQLCSRENQSLADHIDADLMSTLAQNSSSLAAASKASWMWRKIGDGHHLVCQILLGIMENRQFAIRNRPGDPPIANQPDTAVLVRSIVFEAFPLAGRFVETNPVNGFADARKHFAWD